MKKNRKLNNEEFITLAQNLLEDKYEYLSEYTDSTCKMKIRCKKHNIEFEQSATNHIRIKSNGKISTGCPSCKKEVANTRSTDFFINKAREIHGDKYDYSKSIYVKNNIKIEIICKKHGSFFQKPNDHITNKQNCPKCNVSKGEEKIMLFLEKNNVRYEKEKVFKECIFKKPLKFDFYLPENNILIEYDGSQHFKPMAHKEGRKKFKETLIKDKIKNNFTSRIGVNLIRIPYTEFNNIEKILNSLLSL
jgi:very-short-patch-repair endonuclease